MSKIKWGMFALAVALLLIIGAGISQADEEKTFFWNRMDVDIVVQENSDLRIDETWEATFTSGTFQFAYRDIPMDKLTGISDVSVSEQGRQYAQGSTQEPYTFTTSQTGRNFRIRFYFPPTSDSTHTFKLSYTVSGALRYYEGGDQVWWKAVFPDRTFPVNSAKVTVNLPPGAIVDNVAVTARRPPRDHRRPQVVFRAPNPSRAGVTWVRVQFPHGIVQGQAAPWQAAADRRPPLASASSNTSPPSI